MAQLAKSPALGQLRLQKEMGRCVLWKRSEALYNLISIGVLDEEGRRIQVQQGIVIVNQGDRVILKREKCGGLYKLKEGYTSLRNKTQLNMEFQG